MIDKVSCKNNMMEQQINYIVQCNVLWFIWEFQECSQLSQVVHPVLTSNYARPLPLVAIPHHDVAQHYENDVLLTPTLSVILNLQFWKKCVKSEKLLKYDLRPVNEFEFVEKSPSIAKIRIDLYCPLEPLSGFINFSLCPHDFGCG